MKRILLVLAFFSCGAAAAGTAVDLRADMAAIDRAFIPVWALALEGRLDLAARAMPVLQREWNRFKESHPAGKAADPGWRADVDRIDALIREADTILDGGRFPDLVRAPLDRAALLFVALRRRAGIEDYYIDRLLAFRVPMDVIVAAGRDKTPDATAIGRIRAAYGPAREAWARLTPAEPPAYFTLGPVQRAALPGLVADGHAALAVLGRALDAGEAPAIAAAAIAIRPPFLGAYYAFGDFHALVWVPAEVCR